MLAIAHDDDLQIIQSKVVRPNQMQNFAETFSDVRAKETHTSDAVLNFLHENEIPLLIENGGK